MTEQQRRDILVETVQMFGKEQWFRDATVWDKHPIMQCPTLEFKVNYIPIFERKRVMDFAGSLNLRERFVIVDKQGNPIE